MMRRLKGNLHRGSKRWLLDTEMTVCPDKCRNLEDGVCRLAVGDINNFPCPYEDPSLQDSIRAMGPVELWLNGSGISRSFNGRKI